MSKCCDHDHSSTDTSSQLKAEGGKLTYTCPMHPEIERSQPGMCPECGMSLVPKIGGRSHNKHAGHSTDAFLKKFWVALMLSVPLVAYSDLPELFLGLEDSPLPAFPGQDYVMLLLGSIVFFYAGWVFLASAYRELKARLPGMMTLIALAISAAFLWSVYATFTSDLTLWWELATLITIMLLGHYLEMRAVKGAKGALQELAALLPDQATVIREGKTEVVSVGDLEVGDLVVVKPGGRIPADGIVESGQSEVNESIVTGESKPVTKMTDAEVIAGTINGDGQLKIRINKVGEETFLAGVKRLVAEAEASKSRLQLLSDKAAWWLTIVAVSVGVLTLVAWLLSDQEISFAVARLVAVLVIACPHALGLAVPLVASISTNLAAANGFIIKQRLALERAREVEVVLFDKTGTLTQAEFGVEGVWPAGNRGAETVIKLAASVNSGSEHPLAEALVTEAKARELELWPVEDFKRLPGQGAQGKVDGQKVVVGNRTVVTEAKAEVPAEIEAEIKEAEARGQTVVHLMEGGQYVGALALADMIRPESNQAVDDLHRQGLKVAMVTGDSQAVATWVAREIGIDEYFAEVRPEEKVEKVKELQARGLVIAMVGDGVNDAPALAQAELGVAIGAGTNVAIESAGIILVRNDPRDISKIIRLSRLTYRKMIQNLFWATGYNVAALPLAAGVLWSWGIVIEPAVGAIFMSASTVIVAVNAVLLRRTTLN